MFSSVLARSALKTTRIASRSASSGSAVWGKSNMRYVTFIIAGAVVTEAAFGTVSNFIWDTVNQGVS